ncbi:Gfo/Idh/MocA family oxidoreductase, partial [Gammaproteobacteria bacterium]|nr:Gfo/Idh/MocA family oxidoreductase [Gammaproteobacteria bacterium]
MINWGILGTGAIAKAFADALQDTDGNLIAVASNSLSRAEEFSSSYGCNPVEGYNNLISLQNVDAIYVATPHPSHFYLTSECLKNHKAVLCEKPMTINATETMALIDLSRKNNTLLMEAFMYKIHPQTKEIINLVSKRLNGPLNIQAEFCFSVDVPETHRLVNKALGGGSILDIGCYPASISRYIVGSVNDKAFMNPISIEGEGELNTQGVDLNASASLKFEDGSIAEIKSATNSVSESNVTISDNNLTIIVNQPWHCGEFTDRESEIKIIDNEGSKEIIEVKTDKGLYALQIDHFSELYRNESIESSLIPHNDSHGNMILLDTWRKDLKVIYDADRGEHRQVPIIPSNTPKSLPSLTIPGINKELSRVVFGCDNQSDSNHAFAMFDHFFQQGGNVFDTAYIYND